MLENITVRTFNTDSDIEDYVAFGNAANADNPEHRDITVEDAGKHIFGIPTYDASSHFLAFLDGRMVGTARAQIFDERIGYISMLVSPELRFRGIEDALFSSLMKYYEKSCVAEIGVHVPSSSDELLAFYLGKGFHFRKTEYSMECVLGDVQASEPSKGYVVGNAKFHDEKDMLMEVLGKGFDNVDGGSAAIVRNFVDISMCEFFDPDGVLAARKEPGGEMVGMAVAIIHPAAPELGHVPWLAVLEEHRNRGLGRALLLAGLVWLKAKGAKTARLDVDLDNPNALKLYEGCGFRVKSEMKNLKIKLD